MTLQNIFHQSFHAWLQSNGHRLAIAIKVEETPRGALELAFLGVNPVLIGHLREGNFCVAVEFEEGDCWDLLIDIDAEPTPIIGGYMNASLLPEYHGNYPTLEAFWVAELFEPMLHWINDKLTQAKWIALYRWDGLQEAILLRDECMLEDFGHRIFSVLGRLKALDGTVLRDKVTDPISESFLLPLFI